MLAHCIYKGVPIDSCTGRAEIVNGMPTGKMEYLNRGLIIKMLSADNISIFSNGSDSLVPIEVSDVEKCISLDSALDFCANEFADFKEVELSEIGIMYTLHPVYNVDKDLITPEDNAKIIGYDSHPVWEFIMDIPRNELKDKNCGDMRKTIYIDIVTGEIDYEFDPSTRQ